MAQNSVWAIEMTIQLFNNCYKIQCHILSINRHCFLLHGNDWIGVFHSDVETNLENKN